MPYILLVFFLTVVSFSLLQYASGEFIQAELWIQLLGYWKAEPCSLLLHDMEYNNESYPSPSVKKIYLQISIRQRLL